MSRAGSSSGGLTTRCPLPQIPMPGVSKLLPPVPTPERRRAEGPCGLPVPAPCCDDLGRLPGLSASRTLGNQNEERNKVSGGPLTSPYAATSFLPEIQAQESDS